MLPFIAGIQNGRFFSVSELVWPNNALRLRTLIFRHSAISASPAYAASTILYGPAKVIVALYLEAGHDTTLGVEDELLAEAAGLSYTINVTQTTWELLISIM